MDEIPYPIKFNPLKHHKNYIRENLSLISAGELNSLLNSICHNQIDNYTGSLSPVEIAQQVIQFLNENGNLEMENFKRWIKSRNDYHTIYLSDDSAWVIREGFETNRYAHIHPARFGPHRIRFKGSTLKTVYSLKTNSIKGYPTLEEINRLREKIGLSKIKKIEMSTGILSCLKEFSMRFK